MCGQFMGGYRVEYPESGSDEQKECRNGNISQHGDPYRFCSFFGAANGLIALHIILLHTTVTKVFHEPEQQNNPGRRCDEIPLPASQRKFT